MNKAEECIAEKRRLAEEKEARAYKKRRTPTAKKSKKESIQDIFERNYNRVRLEKIWRAVYGP